MDMHELNAAEAAFAKAHRALSTACRDWLRDEIKELPEAHAIELVTNIAYSNGSHWSGGPASVSNTAEAIKRTVALEMLNTLARRAAARVAR